VIEFSARTIEQEIIAAETMQRILQVIQHLPLRMQQVLKMYYLEEKSYLEIGKEIGIDPETVRSHRFRAIQFVRKTIIPG
jgi:RNA polymerase sigma factor (sigma-70 family)